ncbi:MAG: DUF4340 domain-containing protein [Clostridia bacterium]|nr:DUF4340 domain-containing protein [Clostridia bacterium]
MRTWKKIIIFVIVFAILGVAYFFVTRYENPEAEKTQHVASAISVFSVNAEEVTQIQIQNETDSYAFQQNNGAWFVTGAENMELEATRVASLCKNTCSLFAEAVITEKPTDLSVYGLDKPISTVSVNQSSGTVSIMVGQLTPTGSSYYCKTSLSNVIYQISDYIGEEFCAPLSYYRVMRITALQPTDIREIIISRQNQVIHLSYQVPEEGSYPGAVSSWHMYSPISCDAENTLVQEKLLLPLSSLNAVDIVEDQPSDLSKYGFYGDYVEVATEKERIHLQIGQKDTLYYLLEDHKSTVYLMGNLLPFMDVTPFDVLEKMTNLYSIDTISNVKIDLPGCSTVLKLTDAKYFINDKEVEEKYFKDLYMYIAALSVDGIIDKPIESFYHASSAPAAEIRYEMRDNSKVLLKYYSYDALHYAIQENGNFVFFIKKTKLTDLSNTINNYLQ